ncbi:DeoR family transcriptional regulator [Halapricum sp. CBA1109]|uniref:Fic family protein n=1 Tax=Halapricum sp. CBA1109 TaxID=2668068 RepID=UPI0012FB8EC1|nr:Fic family protein [Halapricum sp. CBA1109]MUV90413.1 DeoR family transcriptional regulator [Halapricum sp. CBA1109]
MDREDLPEAAPGRYVPYGRESYYLPDDLPPTADIEFGADFQNTLQDAIYQLGRLEGIADETNVSPIVYTSLVRREAVESVLVEGAELDFEDMFRPEDIEGNETAKDIQEAVNYEQAIRQGSEKVAADGEITLELLKDLHAVLLNGVRDQADRLGSFRQKPVHIPPPGRFEKSFVPPAPDKIRPLMQNLERYVNRGGEFHHLVDLGIVHYQFETIHPFGDGNGRLGRVLITLQLIHQGYLTKPFLYPSAYFNQNKIEYVRKMRAVSEDGEWAPWLEFFVTGIHQQAVDAVSRTEKLRDLRREYERQYGHEKTATDRLAMRLFRRPYVTTADVQDLLDVSHQTARNAISELEAAGVLEETTGKDRYQEFKATDIFEILTGAIDT